MILCCDVINLVRRASKDLKIAKTLKMKRSETCRANQNGRFTVINHRKEAEEMETGDVRSPGGSRRDFSYDRDTINKVVRVNELDECLMNEVQKLRHHKFSRTIGSPQRGFTIQSTLEDKSQEL